METCLIALLSQPVLMRTNTAFGAFMLRSACTALTQATQRSQSLISSCPEYLHTAAASASADSIVQAAAMAEHMKQAFAGRWNRHSLQGDPHAPCIPCAGVPEDLRAARLRAARVQRVPFLAVHERTAHHNSRGQHHAAGVPVAGVPPTRGGRRWILHGAVLTPITRSNVLSTWVLPEQ